MRTQFDGSSLVTPTAGSTSASTTLGAPLGYAAPLGTSTTGDKGSGASQSAAPPKKKSPSHRVLAASESGSLLLECGRSARNPRWVSGT
jgi:hypothetical protein